MSYKTNIGGAKGPENRNSGFLKNTRSNDHKAFGDINAEDVIREVV